MTKGTLNFNVFGFLFAATLMLNSPVMGDEQQVKWSTPIIEGYGQINPLPDSKLQPDPKKDYKVVFDVTHVETPGNPHKGLWYVARVLNLFGQDGKPAQNLNIVVVLHQAATRIALNDVSYKARYGAKSPRDPSNDLITKLTKAGVKLYVCGQAIADSGYYYQNIRPEVEVVLGALAAEITLAGEGYTIIRL